MYSLIALITPPLPAASRPSNSSTTRLPLWISQRCSSTSSTARSLSASSYLCFFTSTLHEPRHEPGEIARPRACVELRAQQFFPRRAARRCRTGQAEDELVVGEACERARLQRRRADFLERQHAEHLAEAGHFLVEQRTNRFGRGIAPGKAGAAGDQDSVHAGGGDPVRHERAQGIAVVA